MTVGAGTRGRHLVTFLAMLCTVAGSVVLVPPASVADGWVPDYDGQWSLTLISDHEPIGQNRVVTLDSTNADLSFNDHDDWLFFEAQSRLLETDHFEIGVRSVPNVRSLREGFWPFARSWVGESIFHEDAAGNVSISHDGTACSAESSHIDIRTLHRTNGVIDQLWALFERRCHGFATALFGEVRIGMPETSVDAAPRAIRWPATSEAGSSSRAVPVQVKAQAPVTSVEIEGKDTASFKVLDSTCGGGSPACTVRVQFKPLTTGPKSAALVLRSSTGVTRVSLNGYGIAGRSSWVSTSDPGEHVSGGVDFTRTARVHRDVEFSGSGRWIEAWIDRYSWNAVFTPPPEERLRIGTYRYARRWPFNDSHAGMAVFGLGRACNKLRGSFTIHDMHVRPDSERLTRLDLSFTQYCDGSSKALHGRLRWHARPDSSPPGAVRGVAVARSGSRTTITWRNPAAADFRYTAVRWYRGTGPGASLADVGWPVLSRRGSSAVISATPGTPLTISLIPVDLAGNPGQRVLVRVPATD